MHQRRAIFRWSRLLAWVGSLLLLTGGFSTAESAPPARQRPNIVFVFSDDHAVQAMGAYPSWLHDFIAQQKVTPNIDQLAAEGLVFENSFCANSICAPSRATVLTGKHSHLNGVTRWQTFDGSQTTFPKLLQQAGYQTAIVGKWHLVSNPTGFDFWRVLPGQGSYYNPEFLGPAGKQRLQGYVTEIITDTALDWLRKQRDASRPFLLMIHHKAPHRNWLPATKYEHWLENATVPEPPTLFDDYATRPMAAKAAMRMTDLRANYDIRIPIPPFASPQDEVRWRYQYYIKNYLRCIKSVDDSLGRVRSYLKEAGLKRDTVVIYCSDQGFYLGEHSWFDKRWMYEESLRMPLIVSWPGVTQAGSRPTPLVQNIDYAPTFLDIAGVKAPAEMQGVSLTPLLRGETPPHWRKSIYYHYYDCPSEHKVACHEGVRNDRYKLINFYRTGDWELYDLQKDPRELHNVYGQPNYVPVQGQMTAELARVKAQYQVPQRSRR